MTDRRSITLPLCVLGAGAVHGLCVAAMLPMLITLPGPGGNPPPAIDVEVLHPVPSAPEKTIADPATTAALPEVKEAPAPSLPAPIAAPLLEPQPDAKAEPAKLDEMSAPSEASPVDVAPPTAAEAVELVKSEPTPVEAAPDDMPQQVATPEATAPTEVNEVTAPGPGVKEEAPPQPEVKEEVAPEPEVVATPSPSPPKAESRTDVTHDAAEAAKEPSAPSTPEASETPAPRPEVARVEPKAETLEPAKVETTAPSEPAPKVEAAPHKKPASKAEAKVKTPAKAEPTASKQRTVATAKRGAPQTRRVVRSRAQTQANQGSRPLFGGFFGLPAGKAASVTPRRPATPSTTTNTR
ncbi:MAG: hypothetical protein WBQ20_11395 [Methyloceanibacter sp.]